MKLLMHICCSNCSVLPLEHFLAAGTDIKGLWFNPNIHPFTEYAERMMSVERLQKIWNLDVEYIDEYDLDSFLSAVVGRGPGRCEACYTMRLERTAHTARSMGLKGFTTSLLASPYQKFDMIIQIGREMGRRYGLDFHAEDLRRGWALSRDIVREFGLYRQKYCGCIYSEMERYRARRPK